MYEIIILLMFGIILYLLATTLDFKRKAACYQELHIIQKVAREEAESKRKSTEVRTGQLIEKWIPYSSELEINPQNARFIGDPIDFIVFDEDSITFIEVKTGQSGMTKRQRNIRKLIEAGKVSFKELRIA